ncbi:MAG: PqqD family protein [Acidobacteriota bacterium]
MTESSNLRRNPDVSWRTIEGQSVLVFNREGEVQVLNEIGTYVWEHLEEGAEALARNISERYEVTPGEAQSDVAEFLQDLRRSGALLEG